MKISDRTLKLEHYLNYIPSIALGFLVIGAGLSWNALSYADESTKTTNSTKASDDKKSDAKKPNDEDENEFESTVVINDPLEPFNRCVYFVNAGVDGLIMKPLAIAYRLILPDPVREGVGNFYENLKSPVSVVNHLLQGNPKRAGNSVARLAINSTLGLLGIFDVAQGFGFKKRDTGFGETLGIWGVNTGPYLVLPVLGPSNFRAAVGLGVDYFTQPHTYYFMQEGNHTRETVGWVLTGVDMVHQRNLVLEAVDEVAKSIDPYAVFRSVNFQTQEHHLKKLREKD